MKALTNFAVAFATSVAYGAGFEISPPERAASTNAQFPTVASNGDGFFVVWRENVEEASAIALDRNGAPGDSAQLFTGDYLGAVGRLGSNYLLITRNAAGETLLNEVRSDGTLVRTVRADIPSNPGVIGVATPDGSRILLTDSVRVFIVDQDGRLVRSLTVQGGLEPNTRITPSNEGFLLTGTRINRPFPTGFAEEIPFVLRISRNGEAGPQVALDSIIGNDRFVVIGVAAAEMGNGNILAIWSIRGVPGVVNTAVVNSAGVVTQRATLPYLGYPYVAPRLLARTGNNLTLIADVGKLDFQGSDYLTLAAIRFDLNGNLLDGSPLPIASSVVVRPTESIAFSGDRFYVVTTERLGFGNQVRGISFRVDNGIRDVREDVLSISRAEQTDPVVAAGTTDFIAVWRETSAERQDLKAARFDVEPQTTRPAFTLATSNTIGGYAVASGGGAYLIVWVDGARLRAERVTHAGIRRDETPILLREGNVSSPALAWNGREFAVVWSEDGRIWGARVQSDGTVSGAREVTPSSSLGGTSEFVQTEPTIEWDGIVYVMAWTLETYRSSPFPQVGPTSREVRATNVSEELVAVGVSDRLVGLNLHSPDVASNRSQSVVLAVGQRQELVAVTLGAAAVPTQTVVLATEGVRGGSIAWDTREFLIVYSTFGRFGSVRLTRLGSGGTTATPAVRVESAPDIAVNTILGETSIVVSESRGEDGVIPTPRAIAYSEDDFGTTAPPVRRRSIQR